MNLPNRLTTLRVALVPFFVVAMLLPSWGVFGITMESYVPLRVVAVIIFIIASLTDLLDGYIARKYNLVTDFGKFMDPLADKLLVSSAMICMIELNDIPSWVVCIIVAREFIISGFRLVAADNNVVIAASYWGKFKTAFTMFMIIVKLIFSRSYMVDFAFGYLLGDMLMWVSLALTIISMIDYIAKNKDVLRESK